MRIRAATSAVTPGVPGTTRCAAAQAAQRTRHSLDDRRARRAELGDPHRDLDGAQAGALDAQDQLGVEEVLAEAARARERLDRGAAHRLDAVRVGDVQTEHDAQDRAEHRGRELAERGAIVGRALAALRADDDRGTVGASTSATAASRKSRSK